MDKLCLHKHIYYLFAVLVIFALSGCGGDNEDLGSHQAIIKDAVSGYSLQVTLFNADTAEATTAISGTASGQLVINVLRSEEPGVSELINVSINDTNLATVASGNGNILTDENGEARILILAGNIDGAGTIKAAITVGNGREISVDLNFSSTGGGIATTDDGFDLSLSLESESGVTNRIRGDDPGILTVRLLSASGLAVESQLVTLTSTLVSFNPTAGTVLTDSDGLANIEVLAGSTTGIATITATTADGSTTVTDQINIAIDPPSIQFGSGTGSLFTMGTLTTTVSNLSAGGTASIGGVIIDELGNAFTVPLPVSFTSNCVNEGLATIDESVTTFNGSVTATYEANGCVGTDQITATIDFGGTQFVATTDITVADDTAGSISFVDAVPDSIVLQGSGGQAPAEESTESEESEDEESTDTASALTLLSETSLVRFQVLGTQGLPVANQVVNFSLTTQVGGLSLTSNTSVTDSNGYVSTTVSAGTIPTTVVVIASLPSLNISTQSVDLVVSSGVPDQDSLSLSMGSRNPEALAVDGQAVTVTAFAADFFNNPVPDGVSISFTVEGGQVEPSCTTLNGSCSVTWTSQNPRPADGVVTLLATTIGAESFDDENGNGIFDDGDVLSDLPEAFRDDNNNDIRDAGEPYIDFNSNGTYDDVDGLFSGPRCEDSARCADKSGVSVRDSVRFVMSGSFANYTFNPPSGSAYTSLGAIDVTIEDINNNAMPQGSVITLESTVGDVVTGSTFTIPNSIDPFDIRIIIDLADVDPPTGTGIITINTVTPRGNESGVVYNFTY